MGRLDLAQYIFGDGRGVVTQNGEVFRTEKISTGYLNLRNRNWRHGHYDESYIYFGADLMSESEVYIPTRKGFYTPSGGAFQYGAPWIKRYMSVGEYFFYQPDVSHLWRHNGAVRQQGRPLVYILVKKRHMKWHGVEDVLELEWWDGGPPGEGKHVESYFYGLRTGLVGWNSNPVTGPTNAQFEPAALSWFDPVMTNFHREPAPEVIPDPVPQGEWERMEVVEFRQAWTDMNVRSGPGTSYPVVGQVQQGSQVWVEPLDRRAKTEADGWTWIRVRLEADGEIRWMADEAVLKVPEPDTEPTPIIPEPEPEPGGITETRVQVMIEEAVAPLRRRYALMAVEVAELRELSKLLNKALGTQSGVVDQITIRTDNLHKILEEADDTIPAYLGSDPARPQSMPVDPNKTRQMPVVVGSDS